MNEQTLKNATVRIGENGTGFFVSEKEIITCFHTIEDEKDFVDVYCFENDKLSEKPIEARITSNKSKVYDVALLKIEGNDKHESIKPGTKIAAHDKLYAFGFSSDYIHGDSLAPVYEGETYKKELKILKIRNSQILTGFSGSPLLNPETGKVVGMLFYSRDYDTDLGGFAIPIQVVAEQLGLNHLLKRINLEERKEILKEIIEIEKNTNNQNSSNMANEKEFANPFTNRRMIKTKEAFVGRQAEVNNITTRLQSGSSCALVGERRIGKSSLLYHIFLTGRQRLQYYPRYNYQFVYLDMHKPRMKKPAHFVKFILKKLGLRIDKQALADDPMVEFEERLEENSENGNMPVLLIDEFEQITKKHDLYTDDFFEELRSFANSGYIAYITSSKISLKQITENGDLTSGFWNIFSTIELHGFATENGQNEIAGFLQRYWQPLQPTATEKSFINRYASPHPLKMQVLSFWLLQNRKLQLPENRLIQEIEKELNSYFLKNENTRLQPTNFEGLWQ